VFRFVNLILVFCGFVIMILLLVLGRWPMLISNSWNGSKLFMGDECSELVRFNEQWIQYVFLDFFSSYNIVFHLLCDNDLNIGIIDVLTMKLV